MHTLIILNTFAKAGWRFTGYAETGDNGKSVYRRLLMEKPL